MNPAEQYILGVPEPYREIMLHLKSLIEYAAPEAQLKYKWHLPFYYLGEKSMFCFLNFRKTVVDLGIPKGIHLSNSHGMLIAGQGRKSLRSLRFENLTDIDDVVVLSTLTELLTLHQNSKDKRS